MDVIANNIANVNTTGFKASRMTFADTFSQTVQGASAPSALLGRGGTNPQQIGLGVNVSSIQRMMSQGGAMRTDDPFHMMIDGDGFFVVGDNVGGQFFTRAGDFMRDRDYNIVMPNGLRLHGWPARTTGAGFLDIQPNGQTLIDRVPVQGIQITPEMRTVPAGATGFINFDGNIAPPALVDGAVIPANNIRPSTMTFHDSLGNAYTMDVVFTPAVITNPAGGTPATTRIVGAWNMSFGGDDNVARRADGSTFNLVPALADMRVFFDAAGNLVHVQDRASTEVANFATPGYLPPTGGADHASWAEIVWGNGTAPNLEDRVTEFRFGLDGSSLGLVFGQEPPIVGPPAFATGITVNMNAMTQRAGQSTPVGHDMDGFAQGTLIGLSVGPDGIITGTYTNGQSFALWQIAVARFQNPAGLESVGNNLFAMTSNSGGFDGIGNEPGAISSTILGGTLEMSNVDLASEFTEMITTQRGFQANSRVITTSDEILQELVNLRR